MNQKKAKQLRKEARQQSIGMSEKVYSMIRHSHDTCKLKDGCTRKVYKELKKQFKS